MYYMKNHNGEWYLVFKEENLYYAVKITEFPEIVLPKDPDAPPNAVPGKITGPTALLQTLEKKSVYQQYREQAERITWEPEVSQSDRTEAQALYTALMTNTLLED